MEKLIKKKINILLKVKLKQNIEKPKELCKTHNEIIRTFIKTGFWRSVCLGKDGNLPFDNQVFIRTTQQIHVSYLNDKFTGMPNKQHNQEHNQQRYQQSLPFL